MCWIFLVVPKYKSTSIVSGIHPQPSFFFFFFKLDLPPFLQISWIFINVIPPPPKRLWPSGDFLRTWDNVFLNLGIWAEITQDLRTRKRGPGSRQSYFQFWLLLLALCFWAKSLNLSDNWFYFKIGEVIFYLIRLWERSEELMTLWKPLKLARAQ